MFIPIQLPSILPDRQKTSDWWIYPHGPMLVDWESLCLTQFNPQKHDHSMDHHGWLDDVGWY